MSARLDTLAWRLTPGEPGLLLFALAANRVVEERMPLDWRVKMRLSKDKTQLTYNRFLTLDGIPRSLQLPPRHPLPPRKDHRPGPRQNRQAQRHHQRPQPPRRPPIHPPPHRQSNHRQPGNGKDSGTVAGVGDWKSRICGRCVEHLLASSEDEVTRFRARGHLSLWSSFWGQPQVK